MTRTGTIGSWTYSTVIALLDDGRWRIVCEAETGEQRILGYYARSDSETEAERKVAEWVDDLRMRAQGR